MRSKKSTAAAIVGLAAFLGGAPTVMADTITDIELEETFGSSDHHTIIFVYRSASSVSQGTKFNYDVYLTGGSSLDAVDPGSYATFYDFYGYVDGTADFNEDTTLFAGSTWSLSTQLIGVDVPGVNASDDPTKTNFTIDYSGATFLAPATMKIGEFSAVSTSSEVTSTRPYSVESFDRKITDGTPGEYQYSLTFTKGPVAAPAPAAVWGGAGLLGLIGSMYVKRRRALRD